MGREEGVNNEQKMSGPAEQRQASNARLAQRDGCTGQETFFRSLSSIFCGNKCK